MVYRPYEAGDEEPNYDTINVDKVLNAKRRKRHSRSRRRGQRKPNPKLEARRVIHHLDTSAMETGNRSDKAESEPVTWSAAVAFQPVKPLEDVLAFIGGNSRPVVGD